MCTQDALYLLFLLSQGEIGEVQFDDEHKSEEFSAQNCAIRKKKLNKCGNVINLSFVKLNNCVLYKICSLL